MELQHFVMELFLDDRSFLAPVKNPKMILEHGTGIGTRTQAFFMTDSVR